MRFAVFFAIIAALLVAVALTKGSLALLLLWPATGCALLAWAYTRSQTSVFGKQNGMLPVWAVILHFPYLAANWSLWHLHRLIARESPRHELLPAVWIGRRLLPHELPLEFEHVIDLTCEFSEPRAIRTRSRYRCLPILDGGVVSPSFLLEFLQEIDPQRGPVYIHCAGGKGRTGLVAAVLAIVHGKAATADEAIDFVRQQRNLVAISRPQRRIVEEALRLWKDEPLRVGYASTTQDSISKDN